MKQVTKEENEFQESERRRFENEETSKNNAKSFQTEQHRLQSFIRQQMEEKRERDLKDVNHRKNMSACYPPNQPVGIPPRNAFSKNAELRKYLQDQIKQKKKRNDEERSEGLKFERELLRNASSEFEKSKLSKQRMNRQARQEMKNAWENEKSHRQFIKEKMYKATRRLPAQRSRPSNAGSVGFDMRFV
uniref:Uncharacterized protein n=1 Tax=Aplanochytrium stocchinoi TaxID=215587 RepID=A0A7S3PLR5_9STRA